MPCPYLISFIYSLENFVPEPGLIRRSIYVKPGLFIETRGRPPCGLKKRADLFGLHHLVIIGTPASSVSNNFQNRGVKVRRFLHNHILPFPSTSIATKLA